MTRRVFDPYLDRDEWWVVVVAGVIVGAIWLTWFVVDWPHPNWSWLWGTGIAVVCFLVFSVGPVLQGRDEANRKQQLRQERLKTQMVCPRCDGDGWVPR